jgi:NADP-dependent 3-hydroxy acid dehydrogenase YdfG
MRGVPLTCRQMVPSASLDIAVFDLANLSTVHSWANSALDQLQLDVLVNNAGVMACPKMETVDGFEYQVAEWLAFKWVCFHIVMQG